MMTDRGDAQPRPADDPRPGKPTTRDITGVLVLDKPTGITSNQALQRVKRLFRARKAGHTGSLDPLASGLLPICLGEATKISGLLLDAAKSYEVVARLGTRTDTADADGRTVESRDWSHVDRAAVERVLPEFVGDIEQVPPMYSALKYEGKRLYALARAGRSIDRPPRPVTIYSMESVGLEGRDLTLRVRCSKGTYVRTLVEDVAAALGTVAHVAGLRRLAAGALGESSMVTLDTVTSAAEQGDAALDALLVSPDATLPDVPQVALDAERARKVLTGQSIEANGSEPGLVRLYGPGPRFLGLGEVRADGTLAPRRLFRVESRFSAASNSAKGSQT